MQASSAELPQRSEPRPAGSPDATADSPDFGEETGGGNRIPEALNDFEIETLMLNLDASLRVHERAHFFSWTQGLLQSLIRHEVLICALRNGESLSLQVDSFSSIAPDQAIFGEMFLRDAQVVPSLINAWEERSFRPVIRNSAASPYAKGHFAQELEHIGATQLLSHGTHDAAGQVTGLFTFACLQGTVGQRHAYLARLIVPFLHAAWVRTQVSGRTKANDGVKSEGAGNITVREQEILRWIYLGKSNFEIGTILAISPLTVKNHVQKILRKLNVVNRAQAIGKALELRVLKP